jgi:cell division protein FtsW
VQILLYMGLLMLLGLVVMFAIGPQRANVLNGAFGSDYSSTYFFTKQVVSVLIALAAFTAFAFIPYTYIIKYRRALLYTGIGACLLLAIASVAHLGIAQETYGATRWFNLGPLGSLQPAEILKFGVLLFLAVFLGVQVKRDQINNWKETLLPVGIVLAIASLFIVVIQKDLGTGISMFAIVITMLFVAGISKKVGLTLAIVILIAGAFLIVSAPHRVERVMTFLQGDATTTEDDSSYQIEHAKTAIGSGGLFGVGIGNSVQATGYLPEAINDSVFAIMGETFGLVGLVATIALFAALLMRLLRVMDHLVDYRLKLIAAGVFGWFGAHVMLNIGAMTGLIPLTGITLPLLSFGGTSMLFVAAALGLVFQLSRYTVYGAVKEASNEDFGGRRRVGGTRYPSRGSTQRTR